MPNCCEIRYHSGMSDDDWTKGRALYQEERYEEAIPCLQRAANATDDEDASAFRGPALNHLGMAQFVLRRYEEAEATFRAAILQTPGKPRLHYNLGNSLLAVGRTEDAKRQYDRALTLDPTYQEAREALTAIAAEASTSVSSEDNMTLPPPANGIPMTTEVLAPSWLSTAPTPPRPAATETDLEDTRHAIQKLEEQLRESHETVLKTRRLLEQLEKAEEGIMEQLLKAVRKYEDVREDSLRDAAMKRAQELLSEAMRRTQ